MRETEVKIFDTNGSVYRKAIEMDFSKFNKIKELINKEISNGFSNQKKYSYNSRAKSDLRPLLINDEGISFLTITQTRFIDFKFNSSFADDEVNVCLIVEK